MWLVAGSTGAIGLEIAIAIILGYYGGVWLDSKFGSTPWLKWIGFCAGLGAAVKALIRVSRSYKKKYGDGADKDQDKDRDNSHSHPSSEPVIATSPAYPFAVIEKTTLGLAVVAVAASALSGGRWRWPRRRPAVPSAGRTWRSSGASPRALCAAPSQRATCRVRRSWPLPWWANGGSVRVRVVGGLGAEAPVLPFALGFSALVLGLLSAGLVIGIKEGRA
jgi:hypothetical protein